MDDKLKDQLRQAYDSKAGERDARPISAWRQAARDQFVRLLEDEGKVRVLELGSGPGRDGRFFQDRGFDILCTDLSPEHVRYCQEKGLRAQVMDYTEMALPAASFDAVYAMNSLLHLPKAGLPAVLRNIQTVLKPDGLFFLSVYGGFDSEGVHEDDDHEPKRFFAMYTSESLTEALSPFFQIEIFELVDVESDNPEMVWITVVLRKTN